MMMRDVHQQIALNALDRAVAATRAGFGCLFSGSEDYERALIAERRAEGRYAPPPSRLPWLMFAGVSLIVAGTALVLS
jgi:hypothetical protein